MTRPTENIVIIFFENRVFLKIVASRPCYSHVSFSPPALLEPSQHLMGQALNRTVVFRRLREAVHESSGEGSPRTRSGIRILVRMLIAIRGQLPRIAETQRM